MLLLLMRLHSGMRVGYTVQKAADCSGKQRYPAGHESCLHVVLHQAQTADYMVQQMRSTAVASRLSQEAV